MAWTIVILLAYEVLYTGLIEMQELDAPGLAPRGRTATHPLFHKVVSLICTPTTTYPFVISKHPRMTFKQDIKEEREDYREKIDKLRNEIREYRTKSRVPQQFRRAG